MQSEYDLRQLKRMIELIDKYDEDKLTLATLVSSLEGLIFALEDVSLPQRNQLLQTWAGLEEVIAVALDEGRRSSSREKELIDQTLSQLRECIAQFGVA